MTQENTEAVRDELRALLEDNGENVDSTALEKSAEAAVDLIDDLDSEKVNTDAVSVAKKFYSFVVHDVEPGQARSQILSDQAKNTEYDVSELLRDDAVGSQEDAPDVEVSEINDYVEDFVTVEATVDQLWDSDADSIHQVGLLEGRTGRVKFVFWDTEDGARELLEGMSYRFENVVIKESDRGDGVEIHLNSATEVTELDEIIEREQDEFSGTVVDLGSGSGLIKRCPECNRTLQDGKCKDHGEVDGEFDMRLKLVLDNGQTTQNAILNQELTSEMTGMSISEAKSIATDALDLTVVGDKMKDMVLFETVTVRGWYTDDEQFLIAESFTTETEEPDVESLVSQLSEMRQSTTTDPAEVI